MSESRPRRDDPPGSLADIAEQVEAIGRENRLLFRRLLEGERHFRGLARSVWQVQEEERRRLARELHDSIGQTLVGLIHQLERLASRPAGREERDLLEDVQGLAHQALDETRELSRLLRPPVLDDLGLAAALHWLVRTLGERTGLDATLDCDLPDDDLAPELETLLFRLVQEALSNVIKHAKGASAAVRLVGDAGSIELWVRDDGPGFDTKRILQSPEASGSGLRGMRDRVELFGGTMHIESFPGKGTALTIGLPIAET